MTQRKNTILQPHLIISATKRELHQSKKILSYFIEDINNSTWNYSPIIYEYTRTVLLNCEIENKHYIIILKFKIF